MSMAIFVIANDFTSLGVALPLMERDLDADVSTVQWVINAYTLVFGVLIITGGRLADIFGRRRAFFLGLGIFAFFSVVAGAAPSAPVLIGARAAMAVGAAMIWPAVLGMLFGLLPPARASLAGGLLLGVSGLGNALGPMLGGAFVAELSWRWILFLNVPIAIAAAVMVARNVDSDAPDESGPKVDYPGVAALSLGLVALLVGLDQSSDWGWGDWRTIALLAASAIGLGGFVALQRRAGERALVPPDVIGNRRFAMACLATILASGPWFVVLLYAPQFLEKILGYSALGSGVALLPLMLTFSACSFAGTRLYDRLGPRPVLLVGATCIPAGTLLLALPGAGAGYVEVVPALLVLGVGVGFFYSSLTTAAIAALDPSRAGVGGGIAFMFQLVGGAIGVGLVTTLLTSVSDHRVSTSAAADGLDGGEKDAVLQILAGTDTGKSVTARFPELAGQLADTARDAFVAGLQTGLVVAAVIALGAVAAVWRLTRPEPEALDAP